jgi:pseudomonalisin
VSRAGSVNGGRRLDRIVLVLKPDATQQAALDALVQQQQDPKSPLYHAWLTPESYAEHFGVSNADIEQVESWLDRNGFQLDEVPASRRAVIFSGTAAQVEAAFQTTLRTYWIGGETHIANAADPSVPAALATVIEGVASLHDVFSAPQHRSAPAFTTGGAHYLSPADFATIYDANSLYNQAYDGSGETIAIAGRADISLPDVRSFRSKFGLPAKDPVVVLAGADPGSSSGGDVDESMLDVEWSGAVAKKATINFVTSASTATSDGVFLSAQYIVNHNLAPVMSVSYGLCEAALGASGNSFLNALWQQAAAQGIAVLVSAGDSGAAGCDASGATKAAQGRGVNGICSTPYSTCVGGTEFNDTANPGQYWSSSNSGSGNSALGYIPENAWNESGSSGLWSTGGGVSTVYAKPAWQTGVGVPADGKRDVPDVALTAAGHDAYLVEMSGGLYAFSGTSASSPSFAGLLALVEQKEAARLGNANPQLYKLATAQRAGGTAAFHDVTAGNNSVPGVTGFTAGAGYDQTTGLGSVDAENLVTAWGGTGPPAPTPALTLTAPTASFTLAKGGTATVTVTTAVSGGFSSPVSFSVSGLPSGLTATFSPAAIAAPGAGSATLKLTAGAALVPGAWTLTITATGGGLSKTASLSGSMAGLGVTATPAAAALARGGTLAITVKTTGVDGFNAAVALTVSGLPAGVTGKFAPTSVAAPGSGTSVLTLTAAKTATLGAAKIQVTASGGGLSATGAATFSVAATAASGRGAPIQPDPIPPRRPLLEQVAE